MDSGANQWKEWIHVHAVLACRVYRDQQGKNFRSKFLVDPAYPKPIASTIAPHPPVAYEELQYPIGQGQATRKQYED